MFHAFSVIYYFIKDQEVKHLAIELLQTNPFQPRDKIHKEDLEDLVKSIKIHGLIEPLIIFVRDDVAKSAIGPKYQKYMPYLLTAFFFIWINNMLGLTPLSPFSNSISSPD